MSFGEGLGYRLQKLDIVGKLERNWPILAILLILLGFFLGSSNIVLEDDQKPTLLQKVILDGFPSMLVLTIVTLLVEFSIRKRERRENRREFSQILQNLVGFGSYISSFHDLEDGVKKIVNAEKLDVNTVDMLLVGSKTDVVWRVAKALTKVNKTNFNINVHIMNPESDLVKQRGQALGRVEEYVNSVVGEKRKLEREIKDLKAEHKLLKAVNITVYDHMIPSSVMIKFDNSYIAFSPLWAKESVTKGPICFVPQDNAFYKMLGKEFRHILKPQKLKQASTNTANSKGDIDQIAEVDAGSV